MSRRREDHRGIVTQQQPIGLSKNTLDTLFGHTG